MSESQSYYQILGVTPQSSPDQIRSRYRELARKYHPDAAGAEGQAAFRQVTRAYHVLQDPQQRAEYDRVRQGRCEAAAPTPPSKRQPVQPAAALRSTAMQRLMKEAEGDAFLEAGQPAEALAAYREALGGLQNPPLEAKIARLTTKSAPPPAVVYSDLPHEPEAQPFWHRWFGRQSAAG